MSVIVVKSKAIKSDLEVYSPGIVHKQAITNMDMHFEEV